jgi:pimeloyl-ACP methyl ester carboxylesterase
MGVIDVEGLRITYERAGTGPALVLLQGFVGDGATTWRRQIEALSDEFTVVAWDAPGAGGSSDPPESFGMAGYADCLALSLASRTPEEFRSTLLPTMFSDGAASDVVGEVGGSMVAFHPAGFRAMARASAEDLRDALALVRPATLLVYGDRDVRAPLEVARRLHAAIAGSRLVVLPNVGHFCNIEAPDEFNGVVRGFLLDHLT